MLIKHSIPMQRKNIVKDGLVLWLEGKDFTNSPPTSQLRDRSGNGNNATPSGMAYTTSSGSDNSGRIVFDGIDDKFSVNNVGNSDITFSVEAKFIMSATIPNKTIVAISSDSTSGARFVVDIIASGFKLRFFGYNTSNALIGDANGISIGANTIVHGVFIYDGSNFNMYINGVLQQSIAINGTLKTIVNSFNIGNRSGTEYYDRSIYMVRYYNRALTDTEILQNYNATK